MTPVSSPVSNCSLTAGEPRSDQKEQTHAVPDVGGVPGAEHTRYRARRGSRRNSAAVATDYVNADFWGARRCPGRHSYYGRAVARPRELGGGEGQESDDDLRHPWPRR